ncbi:type IV secretion system protein [Cellulomonas sp. P24]|uniref:type IV secretion system protein n=1 Tax=Cellulomonas sp. P24 TaxID=2885206 RepID=UPI00216AD475|nr:type IV secretion system protein [Cellulomonas sp. P24]MCR6490892.1 type IV secretion system protein [Cellulomonas sp. P24]
MNWSDYLNPFAALGNAAASVVADGWTAAMLGIWNAGLWLLKLALTIEDAFLVPDLSAGGPMRDLYGATFWIAGAVVLLLFLVQLGIAGVRRDGQSVGRVLLGVGQFGAVWVMWIVFAVAILAAAGGLTRALTQSLLGVDSMSAWQPWTGFSTADLTDGTVATVLGVLGIFVVFAAVAHLLVMLARAAALMVLAATNPVSAAGLVWDGGRSWFWKTFRWFLAAAFTPVLMVLMLGLGVKATSGVALSMTDSLQTAIGTAVPGVVLDLRRQLRAAGAVQAARVRRPRDELRLGHARRAGRPGRLARSPERAGGRRQHLGCSLQQRRLRAVRRGRPTRRRPRTTGLLARRAAFSAPSARAVRCWRRAGAWRRAWGARVPPSVRT